MKRLSLMCAFCLVLSCFSSHMSFAEDGALKISEMTVTTRIFKGSPIDSVKRVSSRSLRSLYCFTRVESSAEEETSIKHVWYLNGEAVGEYDLPVRGERWRTYSKKLIEKGSRGAWRVDALDNEGNLLKSVEFMMN